MPDEKRSQHVLEIAGSVAGRYAGKLFHDSGAEVVQLLTETDPASSTPGPLDTGKKSETFASKPSARAKQLENWLEWADVVIESAAPKPLIRQVPAAGFPHLIRLEISPFGDTGPYAGYQSNAFTDEAFGGQLYLNGESHREPLGRPGCLSHHQAGLYGFIGALAALRARNTQGQGQRVAISHFEGMATLHQHTLSMWSHGGYVLKREGNHQPGLWHPAGVYPCQDGYVMLVLSSSAHRDGFLVAADIPEILADPRFADDLALSQNKRAFDEALGPWLMTQTADEIIDLARRSGTPAGKVASPLEALENPQLEARKFWKEWQGLKSPGQAFRIEARSHAGLPPHPGESSRPRTPLKDPELGASPLEGIRILDLSRVWAGPLAGRVMADLGADVIQIEAPDSRGGRETPPGLGPISHLFPDDEVGERPWNRIGSLNKLGRNKRSLTLDLKKEEARKIFKQLVSEADIVLENFRPHVMPQLGLGFDQLLALNHSLIYTTISGYGATGPDADRAALGPVIEAESGAAFLLGYPDSGPYRSGVAWADPMAGLHAVAATLTALQERSRDTNPMGRYVEVSMLESTLAVLGETLLGAQREERNPQRRGNRGSSHTPQGVYPCQGPDRWLALSIEDEAAWRALCSCAGLTRWSHLTGREREQQADEIDATLAEWTQSQDALKLEAELQAVGVTAAAVRNARDLYHDPQLARFHFWADTRHPEAGRHREPGCPIRLEATPVSYRRPAACLGQHNTEILSQILGADPALIKRLEEDFVLTEEPPLTGSGPAPPVVEPPN